MKSSHPIIAIGNINPTNIKDVMKARADGVAVISAIHDYAAYESARNILNLVEKEYAK